MPWFKVDDQLHSHPKARGASLSAIGLWSLCGSYSMSYKLDGFVPAWFAHGFPNGKKLAQELVRVGLWHNAIRDGEDGYQFHDWTDYQPSADEIEADREAARRRQRAHREKRRNQRSGKFEGTAPEGLSGASATEAALAGSGAGAARSGRALFVDSVTAHAGHRLGRGVDRGDGRLGRVPVQELGDALGAASAEPQQDLAGDRLNVIAFHHAPTPLVGPSLGLADEGNGADAGNRVGAFHDVAVAHRDGEGPREAVAARSSYEGSLTLVKTCKPSSFNVVHADEHTSRRKSRDDTRRYLLSRVSHAVTHTVTDTVSHGVSHTTPSRPDPTRPALYRKSSRNSPSLIGSETSNPNSPTLRASDLGLAL